MSIFAKFKQQTPATPAPQPITPPDAPKSDPALAAKPVEGFQKPATKHQFVDVPSEPAPVVEAPAPAPAPVVEEKRRPGRPPGSRNKPKVAAPAPISPAVTTGGVDIIVADKTEEDFISLESVTVSYGLTLNMGDYNSARIDVSMTARCSDSMADTAYEALLGRVKAKVEAEVSALANAKGNK